MSPAPTEGASLWRRLHSDEAKDVLRKEGDLIYAETDEGKVGNAKYLRSRPAKEDQISINDEDFNLLVSRNKVFDFANDAFLMHSEFLSRCSQPHFKMEKFIKKGNTGRWSIACTNCSFTSGNRYFKMYNEVESEKTRGAKAADINVGYSIGSVEIGCQGKARTLLSCCNVAPISKSALQTGNNKIADQNTCLNKKDMEKRRQGLHKIKELSTESTYIPKRSQKRRYEKSTLTILGEEISKHRPPLPVPPLRVRTQE